MNTKIKLGSHEWYEHVATLVEKLLQFLNVESTVEDFQQLAADAEDEESRTAYTTIAQTFKELAIMFNPSDKVVH